MTIIRVIDFETTGTEKTDSVIELGYADYDVESKTISDPVYELFHAENISPESRAVHHIRKEDIPDFASPYDFFSCIKVPADEMGVTFLAAHNSSFEEQWLDLDGFKMICTYKASLRVWPDAPSHSNGSLRYWLEDHGKITIDHDKTQPAHRAGPDAYVTAHILKALFADGATGKEMVAWTNEPRLLPNCPLGKFRGKPWSDVDDGFLGWMLRQPTMEDDLKWNAQREISRRGAL